MPLTWLVISICATLNVRYNENDAVDDDQTQEMECSWALATSILCVVWFVGWRICALFERRIWVRTESEEREFMMVFNGLLANDVILKRRLGARYLVCAIGE